jgi:hypothetical protein
VRRQPPLEVVGQAEDVRERLTLLDLGEQKPRELPQLDILELELPLRIAALDF